ncbi:MAG: hypothetical protein CL920_04060 [Deltaproteobacteria bacterium]|nr:hypothetical protein [Deltaproteobacteria bacterium]MBU47850.1 hypothetical protein [Deltaproteobacteria bacterium]|tara:strand:- start:11960 stop:13510 length:1551 start_codon:yes stop_codon:yes gene_type:complete
MAAPDGPFVILGASMSTTFLGVDIGTSSTRAILFDQDGHPLSKAQHSYHFNTPSPGYAQVPVEFAEQHTLRAIHDCLQRARDTQQPPPEAIGLSCHMHSLIALDDTLQPLTPLLLWADHRAQKQADTLKEHPQRHEIYLRTGCKVDHPMYPLSKILWYRQHHPELFARASKWLSLKEYLFLRWTGECVVDPGIAASQGYLDIHTLAWDKMLLEDLLGLTSTQLSTLVDSTDAVTSTKPAIATQLGIAPTTPWVVGTGDGLAANIGSGAHDRSAMTSTIGTSGAMRRTDITPHLNAKEQVWCYPIGKKHWITGGAMNSGGLVRSWLQQTFPKELPDQKALNALEETYQTIPPGSRELFFIPYLKGERSPDWNAQAKGSLVGLAYHHTLSDIAHAAMEGTMYRMYEIYRSLYQELQVPPTLYASGGYTHSPTWVQMQADIFNTTIEVSGVQEASGLGAAMCAMAYTGHIPSLLTKLPSMNSIQQYNPRPAQHEQYLPLFQRYQQIYRALIPLTQSVDN